jgi:hypothetical protein
MAHYYELAVKFLALIRQGGQACSLMEKMPHTKNQLIGGFVKVLYYETKKGHLLVASGLFYKLAVSLTVSLVKCVFRKAFSSWKIHIL